MGTQLINHLVVNMTEKKLQQDGEIWKQVHLSTVISQRNTMKGLNIPRYDLEGVKGKICTIREVMILPFLTTVAKGIMNLTTHSKWLNVVVELVMGYSDHIAKARSYEVLKPGRGIIDVCLRYHCAKQITLPKWTAVGEIIAANIILALLVLRSTEHKAGKGDVTTGKGKYESQKKLLGIIDLTGLGEWSQNEQKEAWKLITEYTSIFAMSNMDLGRTSLVKHSIRLKDNTPFKECY